jgi:spore coat protein U-like protein
MKLGRPIATMAVALASWLVIPPASAQTASATLGVNARVVSNCGFSTTPLNFGSAIPTPITANVDAQASIAIRCSFGTIYRVAMNAGSGAGASVASRRMTGPASTLAYQLYLDAARTTPWGDGTLGTSAGWAISLGAGQTFPIYGRVPAGQTPSPGAHVDTVTVSLTF